MPPALSCFRYVAYSCAGAMFLYALLLSLCHGGATPPSAKPFRSRGRNEGWVLTPMSKRPTLSLARSAGKVFCPVGLKLAVPTVEMRATSASIARPLSSVGFVDVSAKFVH
jgi:hypothetical protein